MSHVVTIEIEIRDKKALKAACKRVGATLELDSKAKIYAHHHSGHVVKLKGWNYPVVFKGGKALYDNYKGHWGDIKELKRLEQAYGAEAAKRVAQRQGKRVQERVLQNGSIQLIVQ